MVALLCGLLPDPNGVMRKTAAASYDAAKFETHVAAPVDAISYKAVAEGLPGRLRDAARACLPRRGGGPGATDMSSAIFSEAEIERAIEAARDRLAEGLRITMAYR